MSLVLHRSSRSSTTVAGLSYAINTIVRARTIEAVVEAVRSSARSLIGCEGIAVIRKDGDLCHYVEEDAIGPLWKGQKFPMVACISGWAMINKQTVVIPDIDLDDRIPHELYAETFVKAVAMAPVRSDEPVGAIGAYWAHEHNPSVEEVETLEALANAAATAIETSQLIASLGGRKDLRPATVEAVGSVDFARDIASVSAVSAVPTILDIALRMTGMGFAAVARVTDSRWITCQSLDHVGFGLKPGDELPVESTICNEIRGHREPVVINDVAEDMIYRDHHTPRIYGLRSYISVPIILANGQFFGTLCAIDPKPAKVSDPVVLGTFKLFAELIAQHLDGGARIEATELALKKEQDLAELREQFIAVLGHDLRNPIAAVEAGTSKLLKEGWTARSPIILQLMQSSVARMSGLVENVLDLARARLGGGLSLEVETGDVEKTLSQIVEEIRTVHTDRIISTAFAFDRPVAADHARLAQMFSNLLANAVTHGAPDHPVIITGHTRGGLFELCVANRGVPIAKEQLDRLFEPFRRGGNKPSMQGLGLGLFIAAQIAKAHGGDLSVTSTEAETCFTFTMPLPSW